MSEGDVSLIRDEDVLRRMWQQTEDFSRKKEIRAHMYRLREERLRNLYSPEPTLGGKGCDFASAEGHVKSFADQTFQSMKSKEVRDAGSPPKEFTYRGQDLKELSNAGWNVESENRTTDDGHTHVKSVQANIEGRYDVDGGKGQFAAIDQHKQAVTEYHDDNTSLKRNESSTNTAAHEQVVKKTDDGTHFSSTTSSSTSTSKFQQSSSTKHETVPYYVTNEDYDQSRQTHDTKRNVEDISRREVTKTSDHEQNLSGRNYETGELVSRKVEYPDDNTKVVVETRCLPDGTRVTSTKKEFRTPVQSSRSELHSQQTRSENKSSYSTSQQRSDLRESSSKITREIVDNRNNDVIDSRIHDIVDAQRNIDDYDFKRSRVIDQSTTQKEDHIQKDNYSQNYSKKQDYSQTTQQRINQQRHETSVNDRRQVITSRDDTNIQNIKEAQYITDDTRSVRDETASIRDDTHSIRNNTQYNKDDTRYVTKHVRDDATYLKDDAKYIRDDTIYVRDDTKFIRDDAALVRDDTTHIRDNTKHVKDDIKNVSDTTYFRDETNQVRDKYIRDDTQHVKDINVQNMKDDIKDNTQNVKNNEETIHKITKDQKVQEVVNRKSSTDQYQTTYQTDYIQKKISNDWSPSQQAWASTLRADTPSTTRPSTRASSPGSRTFKSSTSSLRSSVSPDKTCRKPPSRGGSPSKVDRYSPSRTTSTHSTSVSETRTNKYTSPERRQPHTTSPTRPNHSPDRQPQDSRQRPSVSPEKRPQDITFRPSPSPERKPGYQSSPIQDYPRTSPSRPGHKSIPTEEYPIATSPLKPGFKASPTEDYPRTTSPSRPTQKSTPTDDYPDTSPSRPEHKSTPSKNYLRTTSPSRPVDKEGAPSKTSSSPNRKPGYQPSEDKPNYPHTTSSRSPVSPEKKIPESYPKEKSNQSPDKKPGYKPSEIKPSSHTNYSRTDFPRGPSQSPDRKPGSQIPTDNRPSPPSDYSRTTSACIPDAKNGSHTSPVRKPGHQPSPTRSSPEKPTDKYLKESSPTRPSVSPDRKPGYMRPTSASKPSPTPDSPKATQTRPFTSPDRKSPTKQVPSQSPEHKPYNKTLTNKVKEDHYKFVDEETKVYTRTDIDVTKRRTSQSPDKFTTPQEQSPSSSLKSPTKDTSDFYRPESPSNLTRPTLRKDSRSPSPPKGPVSFIQDKIENKQYDRVDKTEKFDYTVTDVSTKRDNYTADVTKQYCPTKDRDSPTLKNKDLPTRESSPSKYGTYDKKQRRTEEVEETTSFTSKDTKDVKYDSLTRHEKLSSHKKAPEVPASPIRKSPRDSTSPVKSPSKDKYKHTNDFIAIERTTEEINKKNTKERPRQLVTPSTSPTRKPKTVEKAPSTGQSSPTTSVSGFVYFGSPCTDRTIVTDLDDQEYYSKVDSTEETTTTHKRPGTLDVKRTPSPSKIPCRSPSPEKQLPSTKESLPRKSSLKKPSVDSNKVSPIEKPPSSFRVSPTFESADFPEHKIVKKDRPDEPDTASFVKPKPPLERRETYEERCRKILGMMEDNTSTTTTKEAYLKEPLSNLSSPSVSPCRSPMPKEDSPLGEYKEDKLSDFITREQEDILKSTANRHVPTTDKKTKTSRESSPAKLQDIISTQTVVRDDVSSTSENIINDTTRISKTTVNKYPTSKTPTRKAPEQQSGIPTKTSPFKKPEEPRQSRTPSPTKKVTQPTKDTEYIASDREQEILDRVQKSLRNLSPDRNQRSPSRERSPDATTTSLHDLNVTATEHLKTSKTLDEKFENITKQEIKTKEDINRPIKTNDNKPKEQKSPSKPSSRSVSPTKQPRQSRTPSPTKKITKVTENVTDFIASEREQEILDRVQKSLRKLSPVRNDRSPSREKSPAKIVHSLNDLDETTYETTIDDVNVITEQVKTKNVISQVKSKDDKPKEKMPCKPQSRTTSPIKKPSSPTKVEKVPDSPTKPRSVSPRKPGTAIERPQSPQVPKASGIKPREPISSHLTRKPTSGATSPTKTEKVITIDVKKTTGITKQNSFTKATSTKSTTKVSQPNINRSTTEPEPKRTPTPKGYKDNVTEKTVTRTTSDISLKSKKTSPQRMKSKPEIQVSDMSTTRTTKQTTSATKSQKSTIKEPHKLTNKPKSATALNTSTDEDDVLIEVQQAKSSRENSPDRICPTPVGFLDDVGTPRLPDEVSEPDDDFRQRTHHVIHETESIVDDIVEISEDDELFVKRTNIDRITESDECLLSVNDKVSKFTNKKVETMKKPKNTTEQFKDTERKVHSDFIGEELKTDECLLSVSEKVNKFAKGPKDTKDKSPSRRIVDEYDTNTIYQDDYTKLSVNDKAHLFVETAESVKVSKTKPAQKVERPDLSNVDDSLKTDDCLLSVSDKVNKFVKTAEQFLTESQEVEEKEKKIKEKHETIMRKIVGNIDGETLDTHKTLPENTVRQDRRTPDNRERLGSFAKETESSHAKNKDYASPNLKPTERVPTSNEELDKRDRKTPDKRDRSDSFSKETESSHARNKAHVSPNLKPTERAPTVKITTLRSSEAVKKAKALFENIASTTKKTKETTQTSKTTKLTDIGVIKKTPKTDSTTVLHPSIEDGSPNVTDVESEVDAPLVRDHPRSTPTRLQPSRGHDEKLRNSPNRLTTQSPEVPKSTRKSPMRQVETTTKTILSSHPTTQRAESPKHARPEPEKTEKPQDKVPGYLRPTKTSQIRDETKVIEETEVSSRRGSGKFGVELRRTSVERSTVSSERRRSSVDHHQPCIEDIFDLDLLEQMLEKVVGYEQRRRIRAQIRVAKKKMETERIVDSNTYTKTTKITSASTPKNRSPERQSKTRSPERQPKSTQQKTMSPERSVKLTPQKTVSPERSQPKELTKPVLNGHSKEPVQNLRQRPQSPEKPAPKSAPKAHSPVRQASPDKKTRTVSPSKTTPKPKTNRFSEYASAYMKKIGLNDTEKIKVSDVKTKRATEKKRVDDQETVQQFEEHKTTETKYSSTSVTKNITERTSSKDTIEIVQLNGKRSPSPEKNKSPERKPQSPTERLYQRTPSPDFKRPKTDSGKKETIIKTVYEIEKKIPQKQVQEEKPSWVTNRNLKKITSETRTFSSKKIDNEKSKYRAQSPSKVISKPIDVITSSYGPGPLDADGRPLFGIKALRNGASNYQVKGTVVRQEYHSRNGSEPEGTVSVTAYSSQPEELERLVRAQGGPPSRLHGLAAITTTKRFGGDSGTTLRDAHTKEERASLEQFTHTDRRTADSREVVEVRSDSRRDRAAHTQPSQRTHTRPEDRKTVRQSSVKSLTEKYIKSASETSRSERAAYPKAGLILRTANMKDSVSSDSSAHAGLARTDSEHSLASMEDTVTTTTVREQRGDGGRTTTTTTTRSRQQHSTEEKSFLDSTTKVTGVQDILSRMKNADIVIEEGDSNEDTEARALLNKFLGATVLMAGMQNYVTEKPSGKVVVKQETVRSSGGKVTSNRSVQEIDLDQCWDERVLRKLLDECTDYEQRRRLRARIRTLMAEQEACASAVTEALAAAGESTEAAENSDAREEEEVTTVTSSVRRNSSEKTVSSSTTTKTSKVIESMSRPAPKPVSPFAKFRQLEKQNSTNSPNSPKTPQSPGSPSQPYFKFTDPALQASAVTIKERLLQWCRDKTRDYENVKLENFSTSWSDGLAFCALIHHFLPNAFDYSKLTPDKRRHNFTLAFKVADEKAGIYPLLDVDDMVAMRKPDWKCVFTYVQSIHRRFKDD